MDSLSGISPISKRLSEWYGTHRRELPWRVESDPYRIWLSEVILQQTRVEQGLPYYHAIFGRYPDIASLAAAPTDELLKLWQGLGYYSRARNLQTAARQVMSEFGGVFPDTFEKLRCLKGVGDYTAAAIASMAFGEPRAVVDGNVYRVLARLFDIGTPIDSTEGRRLFANLAKELLDPADPGTHNQAMMEFGALHCTPLNPDCSGCPVCDECQSHQNGHVSDRPVKKPKKAPVERFFQYMVPYLDGHTWLLKREEKDIWQHLWEFPLLESTRPLETEEWLAEPSVASVLGSGFVLGTPCVTRHMLSHQVIHARFQPVRLLTSDGIPSGWTEIQMDRLDQYPVSRLTEKFLSKFMINI